MEEDIEGATFSLISRTTDRTFSETSGLVKMDAELMQPLVLQDIRLSMKAKSHRMKRCLFFHLVSGGNVDTVRDVLQFLASEGHQTELDWVLNKVYQDKPSYICKCSRRLLQIVVFVLLFVLFTVTTPVFYVLHAMGVGWRDASRRNISEDPELPLAFAVYSKSPDMLKVFFDHGVTLRDSDPQHNNIFHYLCEMSAADPDEAISLHKALMDCVKDVDDVKEVILTQENRAGLTPLELSARWGSMKYAEYLVLQRGLMRETLVNVNKTSVWVDDKYLCKINSRKYIMGLVKSQSDFDANDNETNADRSNYSKDHQLEIAEFDLHRYERGDTLGKQSYLLQLITSRTIGQMTDRDISSFLKTDFLHTWMKRKRLRFIYPCIVSHCVHILITLLLVLYLLHFGGDMNPLPLLKSLVENYLELNIELFIDNLEHAVSMATTSNTTFDTESALTVSSSVQDNTPPSYSVAENDMVAACDNVTESVAGLVLDQCLAQSLRMVLDNCEGLSLEEALEYSGIKLFLGDSYTHQVDNSRFVAYSIEVFVLGYILVDFVYRITYLVRNIKTTRTFPHVSLTAVTSRRFPGSYVEKQLLLIMHSMFTIYLVVYWNLNEHLRIYFATTFRRNLRSTLHRIHQEALSKGHGILSRDRLEQEASLLRQNSFVTKDFLPMLNESLELMSYLLIACLIIRFLLAIHMMRLLPGVGFFVITTRKMARHLIEFALVFLFVAVAFATIFHFVMRDPECPANKMEGFSGVGESLFSTYLIAIGQAEFVYFKNANAQVTFVVYTVISILLLFNLIIAVMSTTADALNRESWRRTLTILEMWDEILGVEATCQTMCLPLQICINTGKQLYSGHLLLKPKRHKQSVNRSGLAADVGLTSDA